MVSALILVSALGVIIAKNPVQSVLLLVLVFLESAILFFLFGAEFLAILLIIVYIGAIAILFLFVVMFLNLRVVELYTSLQYHIPVGSFIGLFFLFFLLVVSYHDLGFPSLEGFSGGFILVSWPELIFYESNLHLLGEVFYNYYLDIFILITLLLVVAMIGVILLAQDFDYREEVGEKELAFSDRKRYSYQNIIWLNMEIYGKHRHLPSSQIRKNLLKLSKK